MTRLRAATRTTFRSLGTRNFRLFFAGQLVSQAGTWMQSIAITWVVLQLTNDGVALGLATAAQFLPVLVLGAWSGVVADRVDRHRMLLVTQSAFLVVALAFTALVFTDRITLPLIYLLALLFGVITALDNPARRVLVVEMVDETDVPNAVGLNSALMTGSRVVGPAIAGVLITTVGVNWCFAVNALTYLAVLGALARIDRSKLRSAPPVARGKGQLREGLRYVWRTSELRLSLLLLAVIGTLTFEFQVTLPLLAERTFDGDADTFTLLYSFMSAGSVVGALIMARRSDVDTRFLARSGMWLGVFMGALALAPTVPLALVAVVPVGLTSIFLISGSNAVIQLRADAAMRGRALALTAVVFLGSTPIGGPIAGAVGEHVGARASVGLGAVAALAAAWWTTRELARLDAADDEVGAADEPLTAPAPGTVEPAPGPVGG
ncbi:MAG: MFS transporter [Actinomycetota bacterium]|nr:MFS transporter [Actinomycetota bacterium]